MTEEATLTERERDELSRARAAADIIARQPTDEMRAASLGVARTGHPGAPTHLTRAVTWTMEAMRLHHEGDDVTDVRETGITFVSDCGRWRFVIYPTMFTTKALDAEAEEPDAWF